MNVLIVGIGGTGVVTVNQVLATAALLDGHGVRGVDQTGLSQKAGTVTSHLRFGGSNLEPAGRVSTRQVDCLLALDLLAASDSGLLDYASSERTTAFASTTRTPTGRMILDSNVTHPDEDSLVQRLSRACASVFGVDAVASTSILAGDPVAANFMLVGAAVQAGSLSLRPDSVERAIALNGVAVEANLAAFRWGRVAVADPAAFEAATTTERAVATVSKRFVGTQRSDLLAGETSRLAEVRASYLVAYQSEKLASRYIDLVERAWTAERDLGNDTRFSEAVARGAHHLMAYKDEYEVARLLVDPSFREHVEREVPGARRMRYQLHPPTLRTLGLKRKISIAPAGNLVLRALARGAFLRGSAFDPFGYSRMRRIERALVEEYVELVERLTATLTADSYESAVEAASMALLVRGFEGVKSANIERYHAELERLGVRPTNSSHRPARRRGS